MLGLARRRLTAEPRPLVHAACTPDLSRIPRATGTLKYTFREFHSGRARFLCGRWKAGSGKAAEQHVAKGGIIHSQSCAPRAYLGRRGELSVAVGDVFKP